jgi:hypothetical protein
MEFRIAAIIKPRPFAVVIALALVGVVGLYFYAMSLGPMEVNLGSINQEYLGRTVSTVGYLGDVRIGDALVITLIDPEEAYSITVYVPKGSCEDPTLIPRLVTGTKLRVEGEVGEYDGDLEISVRNCYGLELLSETGEFVIDIEYLAANPDSYRGLNVTVQGTVVSTSHFNDSSGKIGTWIALERGDYRLDCISFGTDLDGAARIGSSLVFRGTFEYDEKSLGWHVVRSG